MNPGQILYSVGGLNTFVPFQVTGSATAATAAAPPARTALARIASAVTAARSKWRPKII